MEEQAMWHNEIVSEMLTMALDTFFPQMTVAARGFPVLSQQSSKTPLVHAIYCGGT